MTDKVAGPDGSALSEGLGPLPEPVDELCMDDGFNVLGTQPVFTADQMRAYGTQERVAERERLAAKFMADAQAAHDRGNYVRRDELCTAAGLVLKA